MILSGTAGSLLRWLPAPSTNSRMRVRTTATASMSTLIDHPFHDNDFEKSPMKSIAHFEMVESKDIAAWPFASPRRGEVGSRLCNPGEGEAA
jgi:hypothetical protein